MKRKRPRTLKSLIVNIESGRVPLRRCRSGDDCLSCRVAPPRLFPYPTQCVAQRIAEATNKRPKQINTYIVNERQRRSQDGANFFYFALHKPRGVGSMRRRGGGGCAARACRDWAAPSGCRFGNACRFMHGDSSGGTAGDSAKSGDASSNPRVARDAAVSDIRGHRTAYEVLPPMWPAVPHVGRLDVDTEGLLLFTDDGRLLAAMTDPTQHASADGGATRAMEKQYAVEVERVREHIVAAAPAVREEEEELSRGAPLSGEGGDRCVDDAALRGLRLPLEFDSPRGRARIVTKPARVERHADRRSSTRGAEWVRIALREGKNRQVRRLCARSHLSVRRLVRESIGTVKLGALPLGSARSLTEREVRACYAMCLPGAPVPSVLPLPV
jgi:pseudouridine synthase